MKILALVLVALLFVSGTSECESDSNKVIQANEILAAIERGEPLDGVIVEGDLDLSGKILGTVHFNNTIFRENVSFIGTNFTGDAWFRGANFSGGHASFYGAEFSGGDTYFSGAEFSGGDAYFRGAKFSGGDTYFSGANFSGGYADFYEAMFSGGCADFYEAVFSGGDANFWGAEFSGGYAYFTKAVFSGGYADFSWAVFSGGFAPFYGAEFSGGDANFKYAEFSGNANFEDSIFGNKNDSESFNVSLGYARFDYDAYFENTTIHPNTKLDLTRSSYKRMFLPWSRINKNQASPSDDDAYLALMRNYMNLGWYEDANYCYYEYRNKCLKNEPFGFEKAIDTFE